MAEVRMERRFVNRWYIFFYKLYLSSITVMLGLLLLVDVIQSALAHQDARRNTADLSVTSSTTKWLPDHICSLIRTIPLC